MKKILLSAIVLSSFAMLSCQSKTETKQTYTEIEDNGQQKVETVDTDETIVQNTDLPNEAQNFIKNNFGSETIQTVLKEANISGDEYKVQLGNGIKLEFDANGQWKDVKAEVANQSVGALFLPQVTRDYLTQNYPNIGIKSVERDTKGIDIDLLNNIDLKFDTNGNFLRID
ncbi:PepSY-like domain-containing protein [Faecalibacter rhinopitheci]|uniref:PepSY-like domain-containing protein n=1 Tax=Faecalibacter rhinopitheci TaxID=2779678 RepID=A0A8J7KDN7_9FLAO|nr:PepSY-like domain-containing protein [Faecalibacter rhinopitheci]MBF0597541.1 PepSY-like domain-containing protein [Faecalibacter rhinopitheci]